MNYDNAEPFYVATDNINVATLEESEDNLRNNIISNVSVPEVSCTRMMNVGSHPFPEVQPGRDIIPDPLEFDSASVGRPIRKRTQDTRMNIFSNKGCTYGVTLVQAMYMTQIVETAKGKRL